MTRRGTVTLLVIPLVAIVLLAVSLRTAQSTRMAPGGEDSELPSVAAAAPPVRRAPDTPLQVLERLPVSRDALELPVYTPDALETSPGEVAHSGGRLFETVEVHNQSPLIQGPLRVEYTLDAELTRQVFDVLRRGRVALGHVILLDPATGRVLSYASTDVDAFPPTRIYPAASLVKVITATAALEIDRETAELPCRFVGSPYRLTPSRIDPPKRGRTVSLRRALATSNNQCFAQLAVHAIGRPGLVSAIDSFGWLSSPAPAHPAGEVEESEDRYELGRLGCGLGGCRITPLHAAQLAAVLARGERIAPRWVERVFDVHGRELPLPAGAAPRRVMSTELAEELREMLVDTTRRGTARSAFRTRRGRPRLGGIQVAGKTGSLTGRNPAGRYEWFIGVAPAKEPRVAIAVLMVQSDLWWRSASQIAGDVLDRVFCKKRDCREEYVQRYIRELPDGTTGDESIVVPAKLSDLADTVR